MQRLSRTLFLSLVFCFATHIVIAQQPAASPQASTAPQATPNLEEWSDDFNGKELDLEKWERYSFEGGGGGKVELKEGQLRMRGQTGSRAGVRIKQSFNGDRFIVEAGVAKVGTAMPDLNQGTMPIGNAVIAVMFNGSARNRVEWLLTSEGTFEAWAIVDGRGERLDNRNLATKEKTPTLSIARKGDDFFFALNGQVGLQKTIKNMPRSFRVMLYGFSSSENNWDMIRVVVPKTPK
jgi:hypothetical protein